MNEAPNPLSPGTTLLCMRTTSFLTSEGLPPPSASENGSHYQWLRADKTQIEKAKPIKCGTFGATSLQQRYLATGDFVPNDEAPEMPVYSVKGHKEIINAIDGVGGLGIGEGAPEIVTGSRDEQLCTVKVWDPRQKDDPVANMEPVQGENKRDCWTVAF
ncbi:Dynein axonemal assembly factor 10, partial [Saguinus oedipus]